MSYRREQPKTMNNTKDNQQPSDPPGSSMRLLGTPRTNEVAKRILAELQACKCAEGFNKTYKSIVAQLLEHGKQLETELVKATKKSKGTPDWLSDALNSGDGVYRP